MARTRIFRTQPKQFLNLSMAQWKYVYKKLCGVKLESVYTDGNIQSAATELWGKFTKDQIVNALTGYSVEAYVNGELDI